MGRYAGVGLYVLATLIDLRYGYHELAELRELGVARYLASPQNFWDMCLIINVVLLGVLLAIDSDWAPALGSLGTVPLQDSQSCPHSPLHQCCTPLTGL